jgi:glutaminyl-tRNA synthetase
VPATVRLYERLFTVEDPAAVAPDEMASIINPESIVQKTDCRLEPSLAPVRTGDFFQFERLGYFTVDSDSTAERGVFNRTVTLRDTWAKIRDSEGRNGRGAPK